MLTCKDANSSSLKSALRANLQRPATFGSTNILLSGPAEASLCNRS